MGIRSIKEITIDCDKCKKIIATGKTSVDLLKMVEYEEKYTKIYCTDCKVPVMESTLVQND